MASPAQRIAESAAAMRVLGAEYEHLGMELEIDDWQIIRERLEGEEPERVWAPLYETGGHRHHNRLAMLAIQLWPGQVDFYSTYSCDEESWPHRTQLDDCFHVQTADGWDELKREALDCYVSQNTANGTKMHFERDLDEWVVPGLRLNLGGGINPIPGYVNLDKSTGWTFEQGLSTFPDRSVQAVTESHALMYVNPVHWPYVFSEIARVLKPGGMVRITQDAIGAPGSSRPVIRPGAKVATSAAIVLDHLWDAGFQAEIVDPDQTGFQDRSLIQTNYGSPPDVFHVEAIKP